MSIRFKSLVIIFNCFIVTYTIANNLGDLQGKNEYNVTGKVISADDHSGLAGVLIEEKGTSNRTITDNDGKYTITLESENAILIICSTGFIKREIKIGQESVIDVILTLDHGSTEELVATALGINRDRKTLGYDISQVDGKDFTQVAHDNLLNSLPGKVAGVTVNQTSGAGSSVNVVIRGTSSLTTDNQPLFIVDGVFMDNSLNNISENGDGNQIDYGNAIADINPDDIADVSILKGPGATALYGTRAGNGVIIITTKSGTRAKEVGVSISSNTLFERPYKFLDFHYKYANGTRNSTLDEGSVYWGGPELDAGIIAQQFGYDQPTELRSYPDNMKEFLETGITSNNNIAVSGGSENTDFRVSYSNMSLKGMIPNSDRYNNSLKTNINYTLFSKLNFNSNVTVSRTNSNDIPSVGDRRNNPLEAIYSTSYIDVELMKDYWEPGLEGIQQLKIPTGDNPYFIAYGMSNSFVRDRIYGNLSATYELTKDFSVTIRHSMDRYNERRETIVPFSADRMPNGNYTIQDIFFQERNSDFFLTYNKRLADNWKISISGGGNLMNKRETSTKIGSGYSIYGLVIPKLYNVNNIPLNSLSISENQYKATSHSLYGLASIGYDGQFYLDLTGRNDWSNIVTTDKSYFYPSVSLAWLANQTFNFPEMINFLKLRSGWARVGNGVGNFQLGSVLPGSIRKIKPEQSTSLEFGIDLGILNSGIRFGGTYYTANIDNQIIPIPINESSGFNSRFIDIGLINSQGWEMTLESTPIKNTNGFRWDFNLNFTRNRTTIKKLIDDIEFIRIWGEYSGAYVFEGDRIGDLYSYRIAQVKNPRSGYYQWPILENGNYKRSRVDELEKVGNFNPDFLLGIQTSLTYKGFCVHASFDRRFGGEFVSYTYMYGESDWKSQRQIDQLIPGGVYSESELIALLKSDPSKYIIPSVGIYPRVGGHTLETGGFLLSDGGHDGAFIPGVVQTAGADTPDNFSDDVYVEHLGGPETEIIPITDAYPWSYINNVTFNASFLKLREFSIGYEVPNFGKGAKFSIYTRNLMLWNEAKIGIDPERTFQANSQFQGNTSSQFKQGYERQNVMPWSYSIGFKMNLNF